MAGYCVSTYWDETRSAIILEKRDRTFDVDKEYVTGLLKKQSIPGSVQSVLIPLKIRLKKTFDESQLETGIVVFKDPRTCRAFIQRFPENTLPLDMSYGEGSAKNVTLTGQTMGDRKPVDARLPAVNRGQSHAPRSASLSSDGDSKLFPRVHEATDPCHRQEFSSPSLYMKYFQIIDAGIEHMQSVYKVDVSVTDSGHKQVKVMVRGKDGEDVMKAKHYITHQIQMMNSNIKVRNVSVRQFNATLVQATVAKLDRQFPNTITHYDKEDGIVQLCGQKLEEYITALQALLQEAGTSEESISFTIETPMWKYINERVPRHVQEATTGCTVTLNPVIQGPQTRLLIKGNNRDIHRVMDKIQSKVKQLEPSMKSDTVYSGMERKNAEELQPLFERVLLMEEDSRGITLFGLSKDVEEAKPKLRDILLQDRKRSTPGAVPVGQQAPDMPYSRSINPSMVTSNGNPHLGDTASFQALSTPTTKGKVAKSNTAATRSGNRCSICMDAVTQPKVLPCTHTFCTDCIYKTFAKTGPTCPECGEVFGRLRGTQPTGDMNVRRDIATQLPGYRGCDVIVIAYDIPDGYQTHGHPNPGKRFKGLQRTAYLPDNAEGRKVEKLLRKAFDAKLTFTIDQDNCVTWNGIHHKTNREGGPAKFGYPDPGYLQRVQEELTSKGIKE